MSRLVADIEHAAYRTWTPDEVVEIGGWTVTSNGGFTRRVNSASVSGSADTSLAVRDEIRSWLARRGAPMAVRVTPLMDPGTVAGVDEAWGLEQVDWTPVLVKDVPHHGEDAFGVHVVDASDERFTSDLVTFNRRSDTSLPAWMRIIDRLGESGAGLWIPGTAVGIVAIHGSIALVYSVAVHPEFRRQGYGSLIMAAATRWATPRGAERIALQVFGTNTAGLALYESLGFEEAYRYSYFQ